MVISAIYLLCLVVEGQSKCYSALLCRLLSLPSELQWFYLVNHRPHAGRALPKDLLEIPIAKFSIVVLVDSHSQISCHVLLATWGWRLEGGGGARGSGKDGG